jgi:hypothetical protein
MAIRYFNIKEKPDMNGSAIKVNTENPLNKTIEDISAKYYFNKIKENEKCAHFKLFGGDYSVLRENSADSGKIGTTTVIIKRGSKDYLAKMCIDNEGNVRFYRNKENLLIKEISQSEADYIQGESMRWRMLQSWV